MTSFSYRDFLSSKVTAPSLLDFCQADAPARKAG
jgi:hypothetical protein